MKIVLLVLGGNPEQARAWLQKSYPGATIEKTSRDQLARSSPADRMRALRALSPEIFAVVTERLAWQQGQNALLLFGASAGAGRVVEGGGRQCGADNLSARFVRSEVRTRTRGASCSAPSRRLRPSCQPTGRRLHICNVGPTTCRPVSSTPERARGLRAHPAPRHPAACAHPASRRVVGSTFGHSPAPHHREFTAMGWL